MFSEIMQCKRMNMHMWGACIRIHWVRTLLGRNQWVDILKGVFMFVWNKNWISVWADFWGRGGGTAKLALKKRFWVPCYPMYIIECDFGGFLWGGVFCMQKRKRIGIWPKHMPSYLIVGGGVNPKHATNEIDFRIKIYLNVLLIGS